jgi:DNA-binding response OmpR family regulator
MILLAEDDEDDKELIMLAFKKVSSKHTLHIADNETELPCLIVLDLNMPILNGLQTLEALKDRKRFQKIPKVIFTTSDSKVDKARCLSTGAIDYVVKPTKMADIEKTVQSMLDYCN